MNTTDIEVIGSGNIGDKARQLLEKTQKLREIGFYTPRRSVLAEDFFDGIFQINGLGNSLREVKVVDNLESRIRLANLRPTEAFVLQDVIKSYGNSPLAIRSSAEGDARGTGIYKTEFTDTGIGNAIQHVLNVLASYFSPDAIAFRRDAATGEGFGVIVEHIIGQKLRWGDSYVLAPVLSGFGYTSTSRGEGYVNIVPGLGGGVETRDGERITKSAIQEFDGNLREYQYSERDAMWGGNKTMRKSALLQTDGTFLSNEYSSRAFFPATKYHSAQVSQTYIRLEDNIGRAFEEINLLTLFEMMRRMEEAFGRPQYFEWAMTLESRKPKYGITQVADISKKLDMMDFEDLGDVLFMGHTVIGTGIKECYRIANCWNPDDVETLHEFNQKNGGYVLLYSSRLTSGLSRGGIRQLQYSDFNNAYVFIEIQDAAHLGDPVAHLGGQLSMTGKLFGVLDYNAEIPPQWDKFHAREIEIGGLRVYDGKVKVVASERQNRIIVSAINQ